MLSRPNNVVQSVEGENMLPDKARVFDTPGFRRAFRAIGKCRGVRAWDITKPTQYASERAKRNGLVHRPFSGPRLPNVEEDVELKDLLFLPSDFSLPDNFSQPFPLYLPRPEYMEVPKESIRVIDHILAKVHASYIRGTLVDDSLGPSMFQTTQTYQVKESNYPTDMHIIVNNPSSVGPTHMLAVYGTVNQPMRQSHTDLRVQMFPVHSLVLAANCAKLPPFPPQNDPREGASGVMHYILPVVPIFPSSPATFPILLEYLYHKRANVILGRLLRHPKFEVVPQLRDLEHLAGHVAAMFLPQQLTEILRTLTGVWENACFLGVYDDELWDVIDTVQMTVLMAMAIRHGRLDTVESIKAAAAAFYCGHELIENSEAGDPESDAEFDYSDDSMA